ncbi:MAG: TIGR03985 family CRISPR-associated protein [Sodalinema sp.]|uniref:TIGR03985 family CRISPR-associated protein n=1 Tax=Sodalinema sp. TaxID=3080550 RepID=UPI0011F6EBCA|nr:MAG: TIGR03985 family CRISPR-associated protein [Phormidium sp. SL48-SHIP]
MTASKGLPLSSRKRHSLKLSQSQASAVAGVGGVERIEPSPLLLQRLTRGVFCQHGLRSLRLWVWLQLLYGRQYRSLWEEVTPGTPGLFSYAQWRDRFFTPGHPKGEEVPPLHDRRCPCSRTAYDWVQSVVGSAGMEAWIEQVCTELGVELSEWHERLQQRLFGVTRRSLADDLRLLVELGLLRRRGHKFEPLERLPAWVTEAVAKALPRDRSERPSGGMMASAEVLFGNLDFASLAQRYAQPVAGVQRFFVHVDYVVRDGQIDQVEDGIEALYQLWQQPQVPPVRLLYRSSRLRTSRSCVVYPVCCYYMRRSIYLCGFGQTPTGQGQWYNFRLDHIEALEALSWDSQELPFFLHQADQEQRLPVPDEIRAEMESVWGFDFYLPARLLILRFERQFHEGYVARTFRHETFKQISYEQVERHIRELAEPDDRERLLSVWRSRSPEDAYYQALYRHGDINVQMRLRAWRPLGEVLFPGELRDEMALEVKQEHGWYFGD